MTENSEKIFTLDRKIKLFLQKHSVTSEAIKKLLDTIKNWRYSIQLYYFEDISEISEYVTKYNLHEFPTMILMSDDYSEVIYKSVGTEEISYEILKNVSYSLDPFIEHDYGKRNTFK